ncbi:MAG: potB [Chloroflexi bacterium]|jgi:ABC-type spermidine/putrescine transport system permease subunit I|nr:potB [Chloroflexota bacterium]
MTASLQSNNSPAQPPERKQKTERDSIVAWLFLAPALLFLTGFFVIPVLWLVRLSLYSRPGSASPGGSRFYDPNTFTFNQYGTLLGDAYYLRILGGTLVQAVLITICVMVLAYPCAVLIHRGSSRFKVGALLLVMLPKLTNLLVLTYGLLVLFSNSGLINQVLLALGIIKEPISMFANTFAVVVTETVLLCPYPILLLVSLFERLDPNLEQAARGMGASPFRAFYETTFRLTFSGAVAGAGITFVWAFGAYVGPVIMGNPDNYTTAVEVFDLTFSQNNWPLGAALAVSNVLFVIVLLGLTGLLRWFIVDRHTRRLKAVPAGGQP